MVTSIQISEELHHKLQVRKIVEHETFEEVIWDMLEDLQEVNAKTKRDIAEARAEIKAGKYKTLAEVKKEMGL